MYCKLFIRIYRLLNVQIFDLTLIWVKGRTVVHIQKTRMSLIDSVTKLISRVIKRFLTEILNWNFYILYRTEVLGPIMGQNFWTRNWRPEIVDQNLLRGQEISFESTCFVKDRWKFGPMCVKRYKDDINFSNRFVIN